MTIPPIRFERWGLRSAVCCGAALLLAAAFVANAAAQSDDKVQKARAAAEEARREPEMQRAMAIEQREQAIGQIKELAQQLEAQQRQFESQKREYEKVLSVLQAAAGQGGWKQVPADAYAQAVQQLEAARSQLAQFEKQRYKANPLPENAQTRVFTLQHSKAPQLIGVLADIVGDRGLRMAVDERSNSLVVSADDKTMSIVEALVAKLDQSAETSAAGRASTETLQLRIVWLLDGVEGREPTGKIVSPQALDALKQLGFEQPSVVCQQVTTMTLGDSRNMPQGQFDFMVPVLINDATWQLTGTGTVSPAGDKFAVRFALEAVEVPPPGPGTRDRRSRNRLTGSIYTPLGHYTVMGTTTFVHDSEHREQHLSAFVVYLDRAPEFPAASDERSRR